MLNLVSLIIGAVAFGAIWIALALYVASLVWSGRQAAPAPLSS